MKPIKLYKIKRVSGAVKITPNPPSEDAVPFGVRLVADEGKAITEDGIIFYPAKDIYFAEGEEAIEEKIEAIKALWRDVDAPIVDTNILLDD